MSTKELCLSKSGSNSSTQTGYRLATNTWLRKHPLSTYNARLDADFSDTVLAGHAHAGTDFGLNDRTSLGVKLTYSVLGDIEYTGPYQLHAVHRFDPDFTHTDRVHRDALLDATVHRPAWSSAACGVGRDPDQPPNVQAEAPSDSARAPTGDLPEDGRETTAQHGSAGTERRPVSSVFLVFRPGPCFAGPGDVSLVRCLDRPVCEPAEHDVGHVDKLVFDDSIQNRMIVAMDGAPPGRHAVDELFAVGEAQSNAFGGNNRKHGGFPGHRRVGMPDLRAVYSQQFLPMRIRHVPHVTF